MWKYFSSWDEYKEILKSTIVKQVSQIRKTTNLETQNQLSDVTKFLTDISDSELETLSLKTKKTY